MLCALWGGEVDHCEQQRGKPDVCKLCQQLLDSGRRQPGPKANRSPEVLARAAELRADGLTYERVAEQLGGQPHTIVPPTLSPLG